jgi:PAS domain S-box-containing protein
MKLLPLHTLGAKFLFGLMLLIFPLTAYLLHLAAVEKSIETGEVNRNLFYYYQTVSLNENALLSNMQRMLIKTSEDFFSNPLAFNQKKTEKLIEFKFQLNNIGMIYTVKNKIISAIPLTAESIDDFLFGVDSAKFISSFYLTNKKNELVLFYKPGNSDYLFFVSLDPAKVYLSENLIHSYLNTEAISIFYNRCDEIVYVSPTKYQDSVRTTSLLFPNGTKDNTVNLFGSEFIQFNYSTKTPLNNLSTRLKILVPQKSVSKPVDLLIYHNLLFFAIMLLISGTLGWLLFHRKIIVPIARLKNEIAGIMKGNFNADLQKINYDDEIAELSNNFLELEKVLKEREIERDKAKDRLIQSQKDIQEILQNVNEIIHVSAIENENVLQGKLLFLNERVEIILGYSIQDFYDEPALWIKILHPEDVSKVYKLTKEIALHKKNVVRRYRMLHKTEKRYVWLEDFVTPKLDEDGKVIQLFGFARDITEQIEADKNILLKNFAIDSSGDAIAFFDLEGILTVVNQASLTMWGYKEKEEVIGKKASSFWLNSPLVENIINEMKIKGNWSGELTALKLDGSTFDAQVTANVVKDESGKHIAFLSIMRDVTNKKLALDQLKMQAQIIDQIHEAVIVTDMNAVIQKFNKGAERIYGYSSREMVGKHISILFFPEDLPVLERDIIGRLLIKGSNELKVRRRRKNGEVFYVHLYLSVLKNDKYENVGMIGYSVDITEQTLAEQALKESEEKFRKVFENSPLGIIIVNLDGRIIKANKTFSHYVQYTQEELLAYNLTDLVTSEEKPIVDHFFNEAQATKRIGFEIENRYVSKEGAVIWAETNAAVIYDAFAKPKMAVITINNITHRKEFEKERNKLFKEISSSRLQLKNLYSELLKIQEEERRRISLELHDDIGQLLTAVKYNLIILKKAESPNQIGDQSDKSIELLDQIIRKIKDITVNLHPSMLDDLGFIPALRWYFRKIGDSFNITINFDTVIENLKFNKDVEISIFRIIQETITNAVKHSGTKHIDIVIEETANNIVLTLKDSGKGFDVNKTFRSLNFSEHLGLKNIKQRAELIGASLAFNSSDTKGTEIIMKIPLTTLANNG